MGIKSNIMPEDIEHKSVRDIVDFVNSSFQEDISIQSISRKFYINPNYISQVFKREVGMNFTEYLTKLRIEYACYLLRETQISLQEVSEKAGYNDYFYFARIFKIVSGSTPTQYRST